MSKKLKEDEATFIIHGELAKVLEGMEGTNCGR